VEVAGSFGTASGSPAGQVSGGGLDELAAVVDTVVVGAVVEGAVCVACDDLAGGGGVNPGAVIAAELGVGLGLGFGGATTFTTTGGTGACTVAVPPEPSSSVVATSRTPTLSGAFVAPHAASRSAAGTASSAATRSRWDRCVTVHPFVNRSVGRR
jgi:hypothetical protein